MPRKEKRTLVAQNIYIIGEYSKFEPTKFELDFRVFGKRYRKTIVIDDLMLGKKQRIEKAKAALAKYKEEIEFGKRPDRTLTIDKLWTLYFATLDQSKRWTYEQKLNYQRYIQPHIGSMRAMDVRPMHISMIIQRMSEKGYKPRTQKLVLNALKPMFRFALQNQLLHSDPTQFITIKIPSQKKIVTDASTKLKKIYEAIVELYKDDPYYQALLLFGFTGRRKSEVLTLTWERIDLKHDYYWLDETKPNEQQRYSLPARIKELLISIPIGERKGYVFKSPLDENTHLKEFRRHIARVREKSGVKELTYHLMRNILVSALVEEGLEAPYLSGVLGHRDINTINKYLTNNTYKSSIHAYTTVDTILGKVGFA